jgi:hypothetical protein
MAWDHDRRWLFLGLADGALQVCLNSLCEYSMHQHFLMSFLMSLFVRFLRRRLISRIAQTLASVLCALTACEICAFTAHRTRSTMIC